MNQFKGYHLHDTSETGCVIANLRSIVKSHLLRSLQFQSTFVGGESRYETLEGIQGVNAANQKGTVIVFPFPVPLDLPV